jgi:hypothetical protein
MFLSFLIPALPVWAGQAEAQHLTVKDKARMAERDLVEYIQISKRLGLHSGMPLRSLVWRPLQFCFLAPTTFPITE